MEDSLSFKRNIFLQKKMTFLAEFLILVDESKNTYLVIALSIRFFSKTCQNEEKAADY